MPTTKSTAGSDAAAGLEKGAVAGPETAAEEEEKPPAVVDARRANLIRVFLYVFSVVYLLFYIGVLVALVMVSDKWWDSWPCVLILSPIFIMTLWMTPRMKDAYILRNYSNIIAKLQQHQYQTVGI
ncbi:hypothetical protein ACP4OV_002288 [Aristida adscensionis]